MSNLQPATGTFLARRPSRLRRAWRTLVGIFFAANGACTVYAQPWIDGTTVGVDPSIAADRQVLIRQGFEEWRYGLPEGCSPMEWEADADRADRVIHEVAAPCGIVGSRGCWTEPMDVTGYGGGDIELQTDVAIEVIPHVIAHELGHALGLDHADEAYGPSVMTTDNVEVQLRDLAAVAELRGCLVGSALEAYLTADSYDVL